MKNIRFLLLSVVGLFVSVGLYSQVWTVTGKVVDATGLEVIGANISIKGSAGVGTITNIDGQYTLRINHPDKDILIFSYIGMKTQEIEVKGRKQIDVTLQEDSKILDEVVVIGYGTSKRSDLTGSVVSVKNEDLMQTPTSDVAQALAGRVAGVQITQSEGGPGASSSIRVRGGISITQSNEPLYVIDGFASEDGMSSLDPGEIETIDILKDASSTAIYGARGANGVVVITTKKGNKETTKMNVNFQSYIGVRKIRKKLDVLSTKEYVLLDYERNLAFYGESGVKRFQNNYGSFAEIDENYGQREGVDWQEEALGRVTTSQNYRVNISGGTKDLKYSLSYNYVKDLGAMVHSGMDRHNIAFNLSHKASDRFTANARLNYDENKTYGMGTSEGENRFNKMEHILQYRPVNSLYGNDRDLLAGDDDLIDDESNPMQSPLVSASEETKVRKVRSMQANGGFTFFFTKRFSFRNTTGMRYQNSRQDIFYGEKSVSGKRSSINGNIAYVENGSIQTSNVFTYDYKDRSKRHRLNVMAGQEWIARWSKTLAAYATNFPNNDIGLDDMGLGTPSEIRSSANDDDRLLSFFARANYNFRNRYMLTTTMRADGSSKFADGHKWGYFPSISAAWRLSEEPFIQRLNLFSDLKLRVGYGLAGNNRVASYTSLELLNSTRYPQGENLTAGYAPSQIANKQLKWESNKTLNIGMDFGFMEQRLIVSPEFYLNKSSNLLLNSRVPSSSGFKTMMRNVGKTRNMGFDLSVTSVNIQKKAFSWTTTFNISHNRNKIEALSGEQYFLEEAKFGYNQKTHKIEVGKPVGQFYGYQTLGLYQVNEFDYNARTQTYTLKEGVPYMSGTYSRENIRPGMWKFADISKDGIINEDDMTVIGNANPDFYGGLNNQLKFKRWDLGLFLTFSHGGEVLNATKLTNTKAGTLNYSVLNAANSQNRWMTINADGQTITDPDEMRNVNTGKTVACIYDLEVGDTYIHSWAVEDASYLRLSNLNIGYTFDRKQLRKWNIQNLRLYFTGSNLWVWTPYSGFDPEVSTKGNSLTPGVDYGAYPRNRSYVFGLQITF